MLADLEQQIHTASLAGERLEHDAQSKGFSRVGSSLRREYSAFKKVLESSKSRLKELEAMNTDLLALEAIVDVDSEKAFPLSPAKSFSVRREPESEPEFERSVVPLTKAKSFSKRLRSATRSASKSMTKSPHWLPSLGTKKNFFPDLQDLQDQKETREDNDIPQNDTMAIEQEMLDGIRDAVAEDKIEAGLKKSMESEIEASRKESMEEAVEAWLKKLQSMEEVSPPAPTVQNASQPIPSRPPCVAKSTASTDRITKLRLAMNEEDKVAEAPFGKKRSELSRNQSGLSLEFRERSFRTNLQNRALNLSRDHAAKVAAGLCRKDNKEKATENAGTIDDSANASTAAAAAAAAADTTTVRETKPEESLADFSKRLQMSIEKMKTSDLGASETEETRDTTEKEETHLVFQKDNLQSLKTDKEPMSIRFGKALRMMRANSGGSELLKKKNSSVEAMKKDPVEESSEEKVKPTALQSSPPPIAADKSVAVSQEEESSKVVEAETTEVPEVPEADTYTKDLTCLPSTSARSFHGDGWKESEEGVTAPDPFSADSIAAQELKAREAYITAMQIHQELLRFSKGEESPEVIESKRLLQGCFAKIEYWENMKEDLNLFSDDFVLRGMTEAANALPPVVNGDRVEIPALQVDQYGFKVSQDTDFIGTQELKAREDYINAMREHQELIVARVKPDSYTWVQSLRRQRQCLAKLKYWEARHEAAMAHNTESEADLQIISTSQAAGLASRSKRVTPVTLAQQIDQQMRSQGLKVTEITEITEKELEKETALEVPPIQKAEGVIASIVENMQSWMPACAASLSTTSCGRPADVETTEVSKLPQKKHQKGAKKTNNSRAKLNMPAWCGSMQFPESRPQKTHYAFRNEANDIIGDMTFDTDGSDLESLETRQRTEYDGDDGTEVSEMIDDEAGGLKLLCM